MFLSPLPVFGALFTRSRSPKISSASAAAFAAAAFSAAAFAAAAFVCSSFCRCFLISCCLFSSRFFCCFFVGCSFLCCRFTYQLQPFQQPLSSQLLPWLFQQLQLPLSSCFSCSCFCRFRFLLQRRSCCLGFCASAGFRGFCLSSRVCSRFLRCFRSFSIRFGLRFSICRRFRCRLFRFASALTRPVFQLSLFCS